MDQEARWDLSRYRNPASSTVARISDIVRAIGYGEIATDRCTPGIGDTARSRCSAAVASISRCSTRSRGIASNRRANEGEFLSDISQKSPTFFALYSAGRVTADQANNYVDAWHESGDEETRSLAEYLGMSDDEYDI